MNIKNRILSQAFCFLIFLWVTPTMAQEMYPGDINNNGIVNEVDVLNLGTVIGFTGPQRVDASINFNAQEINPFTDNMATGLNQAYADCDGNGIIEEDDLIAIEDNFGLTHGVVNPDTYSEIGLSTFDPLLSFVPTSNSVEEGETIEVDVIIGANGSSIVDFYGITFSVVYDPLVVESVSYEQLDASSLIGTGNSFNLVTEEQVGLTNIAISRNDLIAESGSGIIGRLSFIIIEDIVSALPIPDFPIEIENVLVSTDLLGVIDINLEEASFDVLPSTVATDEIRISNLISLSPNPVNKSQSIRIESKNTIIESIELISLLDHQKFISQTYGKVVEFNLPENWNLGVYFLRINTSDGFVLRKVIVQ